MISTSEQIKNLIEEYPSLEGSRIQVGRERIYPLREGLEPSQEALDKLGRALIGEEIPGALKITKGEEILLQVTKGEVKQPMSSELQKSSNSMNQSVDAVQGADLRTSYLDTLSTLKGENYDYTDHASMVDGALRTPAAANEAENLDIDVATAELKAGQSPDRVAELILAGSPKIEAMRGSGVWEDNLSLYAKEVVGESQALIEEIPQKTQLELNIPEIVVQPIESVVPPASEVRRVLINSPGGLVETDTDQSSYADVSQGKLPQPAKDPKNRVLINDGENLRVEPLPQTTTQYDKAKIEALKGPETKYEGQEMYMDVLSRSSSVSSKQSFEDILDSAKDNPRYGEFYDLEFMEQAQKEGITPEAVTRAIAFGPNVQGMESKGGTTAETTVYLAEKQTAYRNGNFKADAPFQDPDPNRFPVEAKNYMSIDANLAKNLKTFAERVKSPVLQKWGKNLRELHDKAVPQVVFAAKVLGRVAEGITIVPHYKMEECVKELVSMFGRNDKYEGKDFNYDTSGENAKITLKDGTPVFENGEYNRALPPSPLLKLKSIPEAVKAAKAEIQEVAAQQQAPKHVEAFAA